MSKYLNYKREKLTNNYNRYINDIGKPAQFANNINITFTFDIYFWW